MHEVSIIIIILIYRKLGLPSPYKITYNQNINFIVQL